MQVSYSKLSCFRRCRLRYYWQYLEHWTPIGSSDGLLTGSAGHKALASWYKNPSASLMDRKRNALEEAWKELEFAPQGSKLYPALEATLLRYFDWANEHDQFEPVAVEQWLEVYWRETVWVGVVDLLIKKPDGSLWVMDHKFQSRVSATADANIQLNLYSWLYGLKHIEIAGMYLNCIRTGTGPTAERSPVERHPTHPLPTGLKQLVKEWQWQIGEMGQLERGELAVYSNYTQDCAWDCPFNQVCLALLEEGVWQPTMERICTKGGAKNGR